MSAGKDPARGPAKGAAKDPGKGQETREKLLEGALRTLTEQGIAKTSARTIAAAAGVNQALVFYHFGSVDELLAAACRYGTEQRVALYRERLAGIGSLSELLAFGREMHEKERDAGHVAVLGQLLAGAQTQPRLAVATAAGLALWVEEIEKVLVRVLAGSPLGEFTDAVGLARAVAASFVGLELYEGVDRAGTERALASLEQLSLLVSAVEDLGPLAQRAVRHRLRRSSRG
ncbi:TetR family transcriptional regulator [Streptomyces sp. WAC 01529]|uniref:TetR/AcrR family transcriptional regulator n=1 Tax=Streptomyces sp. WAC 01529 TaxID=2203205 RepID=UPI000F6C7E60|nr:TetR/AcrR family transcriptional regulator [Streptomyces sp. WAC 01529]AZM55590.1 TetR family transcriptional regulator [Streptomyces sp. WAC 01529]